MKLPTRTVALTAAGVTAVGVGLVVAALTMAAADTTAEGTCTPNPPVVQSSSGSEITVTCTIPNPTTSATPTDTATPTPTPTETPTEPVGAPFLPYSIGSYFYSTPANYGTIDTIATAAMRSFMATYVDQKATPYPKLNGLGSNGWGLAFAIGQASDPVWHIVGSAVDPRLAPSGPGFHAPADLGKRVSGTTDSPGVVLDRGNNISVVFTKATASTTTPLTLLAQSGGYFEHPSNGLDKRRAESNSTKNVASRGRIPDTMVVRADRFAWALANHTDLGHVLEIFWPETDSSAGFRLPMVGAESGDVGWGAEGQRIGIDPAVNLAARAGCTPQALVLALTLQRHGAYIGDNAGGGAALKMEQNSAADPTSSGAFKGMTVDSMKGCVTWSDFVAYTTPK